MGSLLGSLTPFALGTLGTLFSPLAVMAMIAILLCLIGQAPTGWLSSAAGPSR